MKYKALFKLYDNRELEDVLFNTSKVDIWATNQKWIVHDYLFINRVELGINISATELKSANYISKYEWTTMIIDKNLKQEYEYLIKWNQYYEDIMEYIDNNGGWNNINNYFVSIGLPKDNTMCLHTLDTSKNISIVNELSVNQQEILEYLNEPKLTILAGPGAGKSTVLTHIVRKLQSQNKNTRILVLMFNKAVKEQFIRRLKEIGVPALKDISKKISKINLAVCTIHGYLWYNTPYPIQNKLGGIVDFELCSKYASKLHWDYCIVDEVQDLDDKLYYKAVSLINANHFIYAGDYRQNICGNINVFNNIIRNSKVVKIPDNHRSSNEIVTILNKYSNFNYDDSVHVEQISMNNNSGSVIINDTNNIEQSITKYLCDYDPGETFIIAPISITKYGISKIRLKVINNILEHNKERYKSLHVYDPGEYRGDGKELDNTKDYFITAKSAKGLERKQVILIGACNMSRYMTGNSRRLNIDTMKSHIYVGLSRAIERVVILTHSEDIYEPYFYPSNNSKDSVDHFMLPIMTNINSGNIKLYEKHREIDENRLQIFRKTSFTTISENLDDIANNYCEKKILFKFNNYFKQFEHLTGNLSDCVGIYIENCIAHEYNLIKDKHVILEDLNYNIDQYRDYYIWCPRYINEDIMAKWQKECAKINELAKSDPRKAHLSMAIFSELNEDKKYAKDIVENYIIDKFMEIPIDVSKITDNLDMLITNNLVHQQPIQEPIYADRSDKSNEYVTDISGCMDIVDTNIVYEIKHATERNSHMIQALLYGLFSGKRSIIINSKIGEIYEVIPKYDVENIKYIIRANIMKHTANNLPNYYTDIMDNMGYKHRYIISVDDEYNSSTNVIYERAAIVYDISGNKIIDAICLVNKNCRVDNSAPIISDGGKCHRLVATKLVDNELEDKFKSFLSKYNNSCIIHWSGNEGSQYPNHNTIDMHTQYKQYLTNKKKILSTEQFNSKLKDAISSLFGDQTLPLLYHRAYEDALATLLVYITLTTKL